MNRLTRAVGYVIGFAIGFTRGVIKGPQPPAPTDGRGRWGDLLDPPLPCGECDPDTDSCACLENITDATGLYLRKYGVKGYTTDQLWRDIKELERHGT
jgi:hypothetical protein